VVELYVLAPAAAAGGGYSEGGNSVIPLSLAPVVP
jgi:hypothetical protein